MQADAAAASCPLCSPPRYPIGRRLERPPSGFDCFVRAARRPLLQAHLATRAALGRQRAPWAAAVASRPPWRLACAGQAGVAPALLHRITQAPSPGASNANALKLIYRVVWTWLGAGRGPAQVCEHKGLQHGTAPAQLLDQRPFEHQRSIDTLSAFFIQCTPRIVASVAVAPTLPFEPAARSSMLRTIFDGYHFALQHL